MAQTWNHNSGGSRIRTIDQRTAYAERSVKLLAQALDVAAPTVRMHPGYPAQTRTIASFMAPNTITLNRPTGGVPMDEVVAHEFQHYLDELAGVVEPAHNHTPSFYVRMQRTLTVLRGRTQI